MTHHTVSVRCRRRHGTRGSSGYSLHFAPPLVTFSEGEDVEGIGWVPAWGGFKRRRLTWQGWFRHRSLAEQLASLYRLGLGAVHCQCEDCQPSHPGHCPPLPPV